VIGTEFLKSKWQALGVFFSCTVSNSIGGNIYTKFGTLGKALQYAYPEISWIQRRFSLREKKSGQRWLRVNLNQIFPERTVIVEDFLHPTFEVADIETYNLFDFQFTC
jgi:hypothetical protein